MFDKNNWYIEEKELTEDQYREVCKYLVSNYENGMFTNKIKGVHEDGISVSDFCSWTLIGVGNGRFSLEDEGDTSKPLTGSGKAVKITYQEFEQYLLNEDLSENPWIDWEGGECPVEVGTDVDVMYRNGDVNYHVKAGVRHNAGGSTSEDLAYNWTQDSDDMDIIKYRLHKPSESHNTKPQENPENVSQSLVESFKTIYSSCEDYGVELTFNRKGVVEIYADCGEYFVDLNEEGSESKLTGIMEAVKVLNKADKL